MNFLDLANRARTHDRFAEPLPACWENVMLNGDFDLSSLANSPGALESAYLEYSLAASNSGPAFWGVVYINVDGVGYSFEPITYRADGNYRKYQIRLKELQRNGDTITPAQLTSPWTFGVGGERSDGSTVRLDEVRIRW